MKSHINFPLRTCFHIRPHTRFGLFALALLMILGNASSAMAGEAHIVDVVRNKPLDKIIVSATLRGGFTQGIRKSIDSGAPVTFTYFVQFKRKRSLVWNKTISKMAIKRMVKHDTLKKEYLAWEKRAEDEDDIDFKAELENVNFEETGDPVDMGKNPTTETKSEDSKVVMDPLIFKKSAEVEKWMTRLEKIDLGSVEGLDQSAVHYVRVRCKMKQIKLIPPFNYILFFMSFLDFDTEWTNSTNFTINGVTGGKKKAQPPPNQKMKTR